MTRVWMLLAVAAAAVSAAGCGSTGGSADSHLRRDLENIALRLRHLEDRLTEMERGMGGLASRAFSGDTMDEEADYGFSALPLLSTTRSGGSARAATASSRKPASSPGGQQNFTEMVQRALASAGYDPGPVDGVMGHKTASALRDFQRAHNLKPTGSTTPATWRLLARHLEN